MEQTTTELKQLRAKHISDMRSILDVADGEGRSLNAEEQQKYDRIDKDVDALTQTIDRRNKQAQAENMLKDMPEARTAAKSMTKAERLDSDEYRNAFNKYMRFGANTLIGDEARALQEGTDSEGGYLTETVLERKLIQTLMDANIMRSISTVINTTSDRNIPVESSVGSAAFISEEGAFSESDSAFSSITVSAFKIGTLMKISEELMQDSVFDMASYIGSNFGRRIAEKEENSMIVGTGSGQPQGCTVGASAGVTAAATGAITSNEVLDLLYSLKRQYRRNGSFLMHDSTIKAIRQLKDSNGQYLWSPSLISGEPDQLCGHNLYASYDMPEMATGNVAALFGDFRTGYLIADRGATSFQRLNELYAVNGQIGMRSWRRVDGRVILDEAIKKLTMA